MTLPTAPSATPTTADLDAARLLLARLGVSPTDLLTTAPDRAPAPTFAEYIPVVRAAVSNGTRRVYGSYWNRITEHPDTLHLGTARIDGSGRVHERTLLRALGWEPGHELALDTTHDTIVVSSFPGCRHRIDDRCALALPAAARRMCGITIGPPVVLVASVDEQVLVVHPRG